MATTSTIIGTRLVRVVRLYILILGLTSHAWAQTNDEAFEQFQWHASSPGARVTAMGGTVVATGADATAGLMNPAGLLDAGMRQFSAEFRSLDQRVGRLAAVDSLFTGALTTSRERINALSFVGAVVPLRGNHVAIALARHEFLHYRSSFHLPPRAVPGLTGMGRATSPVDGQVDFRAVTYAASIGVAVHQRLRLGLSVSLDRLRAESLNTRHDIVSGLGPFDLRETSVITNQSRIDDADVGVGVAIGALYRPFESVSIGAVFSKRPSFTVSEDFQVRALTREAGVLVSQTGFPKSISLNIPDEVRAGVAVRPHSRLLLALDGGYVKYSDLAGGVTPIIGHDFLTANDFTIDDAAEVHVGGEINVASARTPVWLRAGVFTNASHRLRFVGNVQPGGDILPAQAQRINALERSRFNLGNDETDVKGAFGVGLAIGTRVHADVAYVWKEQFVLSIGTGF